MSLLIGVNLSRHLEVYGNDKVDVPSVAPGTADTAKVGSIKVRVSKDEAHIIERIDKVDFELYVSRLVDLRSLRDTDVRLGKLWSVELRSREIAESTRSRGGEKSALE